MLWADERTRDVWSEVRFTRHLLNSESEFSACAVFDVDQDGDMDIFCGGFWYAGPDWKRSITRDVPSIRGRYDDYSNLGLDVNQDGWTDVVSVNYRSRSLFWVEHPGNLAERWTAHLIDSPGPSETGRLVDVNGDGRLDVLPNGTKFAAWYERRLVGVGSDTPDDDSLDDTSKSKHRVDWVKHPLPEEVAGHGIGFGDIDGDGAGDIVTSSGWFRQALGRGRGQGDRMWHSIPEFKLHRDCSIPILVVDVDGDGDADIVWGRGHGIGLYWLEQSWSPRGRKWNQRVIDSSWSSAHSLLWADLDGNGRDELIAGKRYLGHDGKDPGEWDPLVIRRYEYSPESKVWHSQTIALGHHCGFDLDPACADLDGDGDLDLVAPTRGGLSWLENHRTSDRRNNANLVLADSVRPPRAQERTHDRPLLGPQRTRRETSLVDTTQQSITSRVEWGHRRWQILRNMEKVMGSLPASDQRVPLDTVVESDEAADGYRRLKLTFAVDASRRASAYLLIPNGVVGGNRRPGVLCLHPTHVLGKAQVCGLGGKPSRFYAHELARHGFVCLAPDYPSFGDDTDDFSDPRYVSGSMKAIWNNIRSVDLLQSLPEVDADRIACVGHSLGGHNGLFTAAFDQRVRAVVTSCGFTAFSNYYRGDLRGWTSDRYMPRIRSQFGLDANRMPFDFHEVIAAIAPRPVFISAPERDHNFDVDGVRETIRRTMPVYELFDAHKSLTVVYPDAAHDFPATVRAKAYRWLAEEFSFELEE